MTTFSQQVLALDPEREVDRIATALRATVLTRLRRRGAVVAVSGGVDSACVAALCVRALGPERVHALLLPERDSSPESTELGQLLCGTLGIASTLHDIGPALAAVGCYRERDEGVRSVFPEFEPGMRWKISLGDARLETGRLPVFSAIVQLPGGETRTVRLTPDAYLRIVAATNYKQRMRKTIEYFHADRLHFAVAGTPNRLEYELGFFVKLGDGAADVKPIAHLYKTQVYAIARRLGVPEAILRRPPTTDTYSLEQSQEEFYFSIDHHRLDLLLWAKDHGVPADEVAREMAMRREHVDHVYRDIDQKRRVAVYLHAEPLLLG